MYCFQPDHWPVLYHVGFLTLIQFETYIRLGLSSYLHITQFIDLFYTIFIFPPPSNLTHFFDSDCYYINSLPICHCKCLFHHRRKHLQRYEMTTINIMVKVFHPIWMVSLSQSLVLLRRTDELYLLLLLLRFPSRPLLLLSSTSPTYRNSLN